ncbi:MAG: phosphoglucosamine mutase [Planctomycetia bacterium]|nr:phosphoglucosamine mutase [Planctomycetia bacterium]
MSDLIISVSGVRGIIGDSLTVTTAMEFGQAFGELLKQTVVDDQSVESVKVAIGRDSRISGPMIQSAFSAGLMAVGVHVVDLGMTTTPSVALMGRFLKTDAAVVITASHNPAQYNGIKFISPDGMAFPGTVINQLKKRYESRSWNLQSIDHIGTLTTDSRAHAHHVQTILPLVDSKGISAHRYRVVLDSINGAGCAPSPMLLGKLGVELAHVNNQATGRFAHPPEPTRENLTDLCRQVTRYRAAAGFAQDPDADRLAVVDERGCYIGEEYTLALATLSRVMVKPGVIVCNLSTSRMVDDIAAKFKSTVIRTAVGEANVAAAMMEHQAVIGGEGNGGVIDPRIGPVRDSLIGMGLILELMARTGKSLSQIVSAIPAYAMIKTKFSATREEAEVLVEKVKAEFADQKVDLQDGVRVDWPEGWVHVRPSNTEPIARVIAEAADDQTAQELIARVERLKN